MSTTSYNCKKIESTITFFTDGTEEVKDKDGNLIQPIPENVFFPVTEVTEILGIESKVIEVEVKGSHYRIKKVGNRIYKILLDHP